MIHYDPTCEPEAEAEEVQQEGVKLFFIGVPSHEMLKQMPLDMMNLNNEEDYSNYQREEFDLCAGYYDFREYAKNLELFYKGDYTFK